MLKLLRDNNQLNVVLVLILGNALPYKYKISANYLIISVCINVTGVCVLEHGNTWSTKVVLQIHFNVTEA